MRRVSLMLLLSGVLAASPANPQKIFPYRYTIHDFPNGLRLITIPTDFPSIVALYIVVQAGSRNEVEPGKSGFAHLFEHMMFRGTRRYPPDKYEAVLQQAGAHSNAYTSDDQTVYHTTFTRPDLETILEMEADRFQHLEYTEDVFRTEALAVLGEYNKSAASPVMKLYEVLRDTAFTRHTYKHTTMGFLRDIQDMPNQYEYSLEFYKRYYRPEYTIIVVVGDVDPDQVRQLVEKYWGKWERGNYQPSIPQEPPQTEPRHAHVDWPTPTLPWVCIAYKGPAYSDTQLDLVALDLIAFLGFSETSPLYKKLVIDEQKVDVLDVDNSDHVDPYLFTVMARVKKQEDMESVQADILRTIEEFKEKPVPVERLEAVKNHLRYRLALSMDNSQAIASTVAHYVSLARTPETINRLYDLYQRVTPEDLQRIARKYFVDSGRTIVTLTGGRGQ